MKNIIISSSNKHKISEIITTIKPLFDKIYSLSDFPDIGDIKEDGTFRLNQKYFNYATGLTMTSNYFHDLFGQKPLRIDFANFIIISSVTF